VADASMNLLETLRKVGADGDVDLLREGVRILASAIMEAEVSELTGAAKGQRDPQRRLTHRNGYRERRWRSTATFSTVQQREAVEALQRGLAESASRARFPRPSLGQSGRNRRAEVLAHALDLIADGRDHEHDVRRRKAIARRRRTVAAVGAAAGRRPRRDDGLYAAVAASISAFRRATSRSNMPWTLRRSRGWNGFIQPRIGASFERVSRVPSGTGSRA